MSRGIVKREDDEKDFCSIYTEGEKKKAKRGRSVKIVQSGGCVTKKITHIHAHTI